MDKDKLIRDVSNNTEDIIDEISKLPYSKQINSFKKSVDKLEESKLLLDKKRMQ